VVLLVGGQLAALAHNATTRHVECSEHGEMLEAATLVDDLHACDQDHLIGVEGEQGADHDDCSIARALQQQAALPEILVAPQPAPTLASPHAVIVVAFAAATDLYLIAPKTSPPTTAL
jgi:hypothetical protein